MKFEIIHNSVLNVKSDIIVNAANQFLEYGGGVCGAIFQKAGVDELTKECMKHKMVYPGSAVVTSGCNSGAKYIIHAVGPRYWADKEDWKIKLKSTYQKSLELADELQVKTIAFPCVSTGIFGCPLHEASIIAMQTIANYQAINIEVCYVCCYTQEEFNMYINNLKDIQL